MIVVWKRVAIKGNFVKPLAYIVVHRKRRSVHGKSVITDSYIFYIDDGEQCFIGAHVLAHREA